MNGIRQLNDARSVPSAHEGRVAIFHSIVAHHVGINACAGPMNMPY